MAFHVALEGDLDGIINHLAARRDAHLANAKDAATIRAARYERGYADGLGAAIRTLNAWNPPKEGTTP